jgi:hypothetical protein
MTISDLQIAPQFFGFVFGPYVFRVEFPPDWLIWNIHNLVCYCFIFQFYSGWDLNQKHQEIM